MTATSAFLEFVGVTYFKRTKVESLVGSLLHTLAKNNLLDTAIDDIRTLTKLETGNDAKLDYIQLASSHKEYVALQHNSKALQLIILLKPYIDNTETFSEFVIDTEVMDNIVNTTHLPYYYGELKKMLKAINKLNFGYKVIQRYGSILQGEFVVVKYNTEEELEHSLAKLGIAINLVE